MHWQGARQVAPATVNTFGSRHAGEYFRVADEGVEREFQRRQFAAQGLVLVMDELRIAAKGRCYFRHAAPRARGPPRRRLPGLPSYLGPACMVAPGAAKPQ